MDNDNKKPDQREFTRVPDCSEISYQTAKAGKKKKSEAKDLSQAGIRFVVDEKVDIGTVIDVSLSLERLEYSFMAKAEVRWVNEVVKNRRYEIGVKFINLPETDIKKLLNYMVAVKRLDSYT